MCAGKLSPAKPHLTNCKTRFTVVAGGYMGALGGRWLTPVPLSHTTGGLFIGAGHSAFVGLSRRCERASPLTP